MVFALQSNRLCLGKLMHVVVVINGLQLEPSMMVSKCFIDEYSQVYHACSQTPIQT